MSKIPHQTSRIYTYEKRNMRSQKIRKTYKSEAIVERRSETRNLGKETAMKNISSNKIERGQKGK